ncbi:MAG: PhzF family phenazine biosynthesis protein [Desulfobulbaceae bacterium]|nr:PhzF family phenazine biosynthesis protein [Desulfobulbaceae bacterium]
MDIKIKIINAFTDNDLGGNPAGVVVDADDLNNKNKLSIAAQVGLSETAFVSSSNSAAYKVDFFTPTRQIPHCGHATIATFNYLRQLNRITEGASSKETIDGTRDIFIDGDMAFMEQLSPSYTELEDRVNIILVSLGISENDLIPGIRPAIVNTGNSFLIVPMKNEQAVTQVKPDFEAINTISEEYDLIGYYVFSETTWISGRDAGTRMFAPRYGIKEESATGMAAGPLACFLHDKMKITKEDFLIEQGHLMNPESPSLIRVKLHFTQQKISKLMAGGEAKVMESLTVSV